MIGVFLIFSTLITLGAYADNAPSTSSVSNHLSSLIREALTEKIADCEIRIPSLTKLVAKKPMSDFVEIKNVRLVTDRVNGSAVFEVLGTDSSNQEITQTIQTPYEAWKRVPVAIRRIYPNSTLKNEDFKIQAVNVAKGSARDFRGVMASADTNFNGQQSKQTILEGQFAVLSAIQKQPDLRKGDLVRLELISGDLTLTTQAVTEEAATVGSQVRVMTSKTKREIVGRVKEDHSVEVTL